MGHSLREGFCRIAKSSMGKEEVFEEDVPGEGIHVGMTLVTKTKVRKLHSRVKRESESL